MLADYPTRCRVSDPGSIPPDAEYDHHLLTALTVARLQVSLLKRRLELQRAMPPDELLDLVSRADRALDRAIRLVRQDADERRTPTSDAPQ